MNDPFIDLFLKKVKNVKTINRKDSLRIPLDPLPEPKEGECVGVDGGGGSARVGGMSFRVARAVAIGNEYLDRDLELELSPWDSSASLEALRSSLELKLASRSKAVTLVDGSAYTALSKWITRVVRITRGKAKLSEIVALPKTLESLHLMQELAKRDDVAFVSKAPMVKFFKEYLLMKKNERLFGKYVKGLISPKEMRELSLKDRELANASPDLESLEYEGVSFGLALGLLDPLKRLLMPMKWRAVVEMAVEMYKIYTGREYEGPIPTDLCFSRSPVAWWVKYGRWKILIEEFSGRPLCLAKYREEVKAKPKNLPFLLSGSGSTYNVWLTLAHSLSTLRGEHLMEYVKLLSIETGLGLDEIREELIYVM